MPRTARATVAILTLVFAAACSSGSKKAPAAPAPAGSSPQPSVTTAVHALLAAEERSDHVGSFALLDADGRKAYPDVAKWERRRSQLPAVTGFTVQAGPRPATALAVVDHKPGLDPFIGLSPAQDRQVWTGRRTGGGWLLDPDPQTDPVLPADDAAPPVAKSWASAVQACDKARAKTFEGVDTLFGTSTEAAKLCGSTGEVTVGATERLASGPSSQDIVAQYSTDALAWTRVVRVTFPHSFQIVLAPIGNQWRVIGIAD